jgi:flagellar basal-body rod protein FlgG
MMRALNTAGTGMVAQQYNLDTIANNLANVNTTAFKQQRAEFHDLIYQILSPSGAQGAGTQRKPGATQVGLGSRLAATAANFAMGSLQPTGNPMDLAINGDGFFVVQRPDGTLAYTRDGSFKLSAEGTSAVLVTADGFVLDPRIEIPSGLQSLTISADGVVSGVPAGSNEPQEIGRITLATFANPAGLTRVGQNLFVAGGGSGDAQVVTPGESGAGLLQSGFLEGSNVQIVEEMVRMILAQRAYEINSKAVQSADDMLGILNNLKR